MKRYLFLLALLLNGVWASAQYSGSGNGTESDPYLIYNETQLYQMNNFLGSSNAGVVFKLMKDLDLTDFISENFPSEGWIPVGVESTPFQGKFCGNNHTLSGLWINRPNTNNVGLFGYIQNATIQDLTLDIGDVKGNNSVGTVAGRATSCTISNCMTKSTTGVSGGGSIGGIVGVATSTSISQCSYEGTINETSTSSGAIVGYITNGSVYSCQAIATITGTGNVGGIAGLDNQANITECTMIGNISGTDGLGGIIGKASGAITVSGSNYTGDIKGTQHIGGITGKIIEGSSVTFTNSHSKGNITNSGDYTGGIVGISNGGCIAGMESCSHFGDINAKNYVGGLIGSVTIGNSNVENVYISESSTSNTKIASKATSQFVTGVDEFHVNNCAAISNITASSYVGGLVGWDEKSYNCADGINGGSATISGRILNSRDNVTCYLWWGDKCVAQKKAEPSGTSYKIGDTWKHEFIPKFSPNFRVNSIAYTNSYYSGTINGIDNIGGIAGYKLCGRIQNCYTNAMVYGSNNVGGIIGNAEGYPTSKLVLKSNVAINNTISATVNNIGRIYGMDNSNVTIGELASAEGNRALTTTKIIKEGVVQEVTDDARNGNTMGLSLLKLKANYVALGWDFDNNWDILETECFPYKKYQAAPPVIESDLISQATEISGSSLNGGTVYLYYKDRDAVSTECNGNAWKFTTDKLQSGAPVQLYAEVDGLAPSYLTSATVGYPGKGTEADPYRIYTAEDLQGASNKGYYKLMNDIDLTTWINENSPTEGWVSIGRNSGEATYINGDGHKVTGLWINTTQDYTGLFSNFSAGIIKNLTVEVASGKKVKGGDYTGILIGRNANGQLLNCTVKGDVEGTTHVGGVTGYSENNTISAIAYSGNVSSNTTNAFVGGMIGMMEGGSISNSYADSHVFASGANAYVGGFIGYNNGKVTSSYSIGEVTATGDDAYTGGLVGYSKNSISNCYSTSKVSGTLYSAGLCGYSISSIDKCYAGGDVSGLRYGAGVVAELEGTNAKMTNSIAVNNKLELTDEQSWGSRVIGGFKDGASEPDNSNYALSTMQVSLNGVPQKKTDDAVEGIAKDNSLLVIADTYIDLGWDFTNVWSIDDGNGYPYLKNIIVSEDEDNPDDDPVNPDEPLPDNVIYADNTDVQPGGQMVLPVKMKSTEAITGYQFDLVLPDGFSVAEEDGDYLIDLASRTTYKKHSISYQDQTDGSIRIVCTSLNNATFAELDGVVTNITLNVDESVEAGDYNIIYKNIELATPALNKYKVAKWSSKVTVFDYILGDVNNDKDVSVVDAAATVNLILGVNTAGLNRKAADIDGDNEISVTDAAGVVNIILGQGASVKSAPAKTRLTATADNTLTLSDFTAEAGTQQTISVGMNNTASITGIQFDLVLPEGVTVAQEDGDYLIDISTDRTTYKNHSASYQMQADGSMRVVCTSLSNKTFKENSGNVIDITLDIASSISGGSHTITLKNIELATPELEKYKPSAVSATMTVSGGAYNYIAVDNGGNNVNKSVASGDDVTIDDTYQSLSVTEDIDNVNVSYSRTYKNTSWQAWYVPFGFTLTSDIASRFSFAKFAGTYTEAGQFFITLVEMQEGDEIKGNVPYFVQAKVADSSNPQVLNISNTTLYATDASGFKMLSAEKEIAIYGTYAKKVAAADDEWYAYGGGKYIKATTGQSLGAFRFYLTIRDREDNPYASTPNPIEIKVVVLGDEADGISSLNESNKANDNGAMFNLAGQPVGADYKGVVIRNGKKTFIH